MLRKLVLGSWCAACSQSTTPPPRRSLEAAAQSSSFHSPSAVHVSRRDAPASSSAPRILEAEDGIFTGKVDRHCCWRSIALSDAPHSSYSGSGVVDVENAIGAFVEVELDASTSGSHRISVRYALEKTDDRTGELRVNGAVVNPALAFPSTGAWTVFQTAASAAELKAGRNVVRLTALMAGGLANIDSFKISEITPQSPTAITEVVVSQAEGRNVGQARTNGAFTGKKDTHSCWLNIALVRGSHSSYTGTGFVDTNNEAGSYVEVSVDAEAAGRYELSVRYVHAKQDDRSAELRVNGSVANAALAFPTTGGWTVWKVVTSAVQLQTGRNVIRLSALHGAGLANIDHFELLPENPASAVGTRGRLD